MRQRNFDEIHRLAHLATLQVGQAGKPMDQRRALFRSKVREAQKREKRIDSPLVRYSRILVKVTLLC
ncbi:hypothetical protein BHE74_00020335 [Ensete ventricosum]|nr:hypothetical protein BHE74_00020335 [Ensete ventricosum]